MAGEAGLVAKLRRGKIDEERNWKIENGNWKMETGQEISR
jgi:hypothetical protein